MFAELVPDRAERLNFFSDALPAQERIAAAFRHDTPRAQELSFHLTDIRADAAFLVALNLFPERFTAQEIVAGVYQLFAHVPYHLAQALAIDDETPNA